MTPGSTFGDYKVVSLLGKGGMGEVWLLEGKSGNQVAAKILDAGADHESRKRFLREAQLALGVKHPNLVETYDVGEDPESGLCYILMEYVPGGTLADYIKANGALAIEDAVAVVEAIAGVLELGRQKGIVHRDIKPANIMFDAEGTPKLADLGIARAGAAGTETTTVTQTGAMIGTPAYMSPEQMLDAHNVDTRADIYSLGVVFFEMLTGQRPNKDDTIVQLMAKAVKGEPLPDVRTLRPEVSASLAQLLNMMVAPDKDGRISTPGQITNALAIIERGGELVDATSSSRHVGEASLPRQSKDGSVQFRRGEDAASTGARQDASPTGRGHDSASTGARQDASPTGRAVAPRPPDSSPAGFPKWLIPALVLAALAGAFFFFAPKNNLSPTSSVQTVVKDVVRTNIVDRNVVRTNVVERRVVLTNIVNREEKPVSGNDSALALGAANDRPKSEMRIAKKPIDPSALKDPDATKRTQKAFDALFPGWKVSAIEQNDVEWTAGYQKNWRGREDVVTTAPVSMETSCILSRRQKLDMKHPVLVLEVASCGADVDFLLSVRVNGKKALRPRLICTPDAAPYERLLVPLSEWSGREVLIEIDHARNNNYYEYAYWSKIEVVEGTGRETPGPVGIESRRALILSGRDKKHSPWIYSESEPKGDWASLEFDDSKWRRTQNALGRDKSEAMALADQWQSNRLWARRKFKWRSSMNVYKAYIDLFADQDAEVYLNGRLVFKQYGWNETYVPYVLMTESFAAALKEGENVLAVTVRGDGPSFFDMGLTIETWEQDMWAWRTERAALEKKWEEDAFRWLTQPALPKSGARILALMTPDELKGGKRRQLQSCFATVRDGASIICGENRDVQKLDMKAYDLVFLWSRSSKFPYTREEIDALEKFLDSGGSVFVLAKNRDGAQGALLLHMGLAIERRYSDAAVRTVCPGLIGEKPCWKANGHGFCLMAGRLWHPMVVGKDVSTDVVMAMRCFGKGKMFFVGSGTENSFVGDKANRKWWKRVLRGCGVGIKD